MNYDIERKEAIDAGELALHSLIDAQNELRKARNWGIFDILGGGFLSSVIKHSKIDNARACIERAKYDLGRFNRELQDVSYGLDIDMGGLLTFFDVMDSFFADLLVQSRIADASRQVDEAIFRVKDVLYRLRSSNF